MNVKIDTKEKFTVITPEEASLSANMTDELNDLLLQYLHKDIPHIVLNMNNVTTIDEKPGKILSLLQQQFYENNCSFVICSLQPAVTGVDEYYTY
jgi:anti-anti-sigma regulatory factor